MDAWQPLERAYREEATQIRAALAARTGDAGLAEDAVQDAFVAAIEHWPWHGVPANPAGWLATTARRKALDRLRRVSPLLPAPVARRPRLLHERLAPGSDSRRDVLPAGAWPTARCAAGAVPRHLKMLTARAMTRATVISEISA
jgi:DNA-directed RNA polymerase specialized sigma24 family protein